MGGLLCPKFFSAVFLLSLQQVYTWHSCKVTNKGREQRKSLSNQREAILGLATPGNGYYDTAGVKHGGTCSIVCTEITEMVQVCDLCEDGVFFGKVNECF